MSLFLTLAYLFFLGSLFGWGLEVVYRRFFSKANVGKKWINPGFCVGPYVPLYGFGLSILYLLAHFGEGHLNGNILIDRAILFAGMAICMTGIEYIAGIGCLKFFHLRLWDYTNEWGNLQGLICPKFSFYWAVLGAVYYFGIHPRILRALSWLSENLAFSFVIGFFFGVFTLDVVYSAQIVSRIKEYADENDVVVRYEALKSHIRQAHEHQKKQVYFFFAFRTELPLREHLKAAHAAVEERKRRLKR